MKAGIARLRRWNQAALDAEQAARENRREEARLLETYRWLAEYPSAEWPARAAEADAITARIAQEELEELEELDRAERQRGAAHGHGGPPRQAVLVCAVVKRWEYLLPGFGDQAETFELPAGDVLYVVRASREEIGFPLTDIREAKLVERRDGSLRLDVNLEKLSLEPEDELRVAGRSWLVAALRSFQITLETR